MLIKASATLVTVIPCIGKGKVYGKMYRLLFFFFFFKNLNYIKVLSFITLKSEVCACVRRGEFEHGDGVRFSHNSEAAKLQLIEFILTI